MLSVALLAPFGSASAAPQSIRQPALRPVDDHGILDSVADRSSQLITEVRDSASGLVDSALNFLGVRYVLGGNTVESGFDCSGFTRYVFENSIGHILPHRADEQANDPALAKVAQKDLKPGDLVFFNTMRRTFSHVGIYLGDGKFIHSPRTGESVRIEDINISYWARHFTGGRRVPELASAGGLDKATDRSGDKASAASAMLASLAARFAGSAQAGSVVQPARGTSMPDAPVAAITATALTSVALNPSGLRLGSTLPSLPNAGVAGFSPMHEPFARPVVDR